MPHFRNFHGTAFDFAPAEPTEASDEKGLLVDFDIIGVRVGAEDTTDSFVFIDLGGQTFPEDGFDSLIPDSTDLPAPSPATTPIFENELMIEATEDPMADDMFLL